LLTWHILKLEVEPVEGEEAAKGSGYGPSTNAVTGSRAQQIKYYFNVGESIDGGS
jgi:hypothetical protein